MQTRKLIKRWLPPAVAESVGTILKKTNSYAGDFSDWAAASEQASGYDAALILEKVKQAVLQVKSGSAAYERDSVLFDHVEHSYPVLAGLLRAAVEHGNRLSVLDFGGSLGSSYFQCREFLSVVNDLQWGIVEQENFVDCGRRNLETGQLWFFYTINECLQHMNPNVVLLSSVLQYIESPVAVLEELVDQNIPYIIIDRTPFSDAPADRITVQHVPPSIYPASYPCRIFSMQRFLDTFQGRYHEVSRFDSSDAGATINGLEFSFRGMILGRN
jgi:putative methyltransferase (TIGR04325 family)